MLFDLFLKESRVKANNTVVVNATSSFGKTRAKVVANQ